MATYHGLFDVGTHSLLTISKMPPVVVFLSGAISDSYPAFNINNPTYGADFFIASLNPPQYPEWVWSNDVSRKFSEAPAEIQTDEIRKRSRLAVAKGNIIGKIMTGISYARASVGTGIIFQETVYLNKRREAEFLKKDGYSEETLHEFPYIVQYADYAGISINDAIEEILFQAKLDNQLLAKTELLRIRYFNKIKDAVTPDEVHITYDDYLRDTYFNGLI